MWNDLMVMPHFGGDIGVINKVVIKPLLPSSYLTTIAVN